MHKILVIEDDPAVLKGLTLILKNAGYEAVTESDGEEGYRSALQGKYDLLLLDVMLPGKTGTDICRDLRAADNQKPIIILTSKTESFDTVLHLKLGADDYVSKPFDENILLARIEANLRKGTPEKTQVGDEVNFAGISINFKTHEVCKNKKSLHCSAKEIELLKYFIQHENEVVSRDQLLSEIWGFESYPTTRTVDNFVLNLRKKLEDDPSNPKHILTIHTIGYKFVK